MELSTLVEAKKQAERLYMRLLLFRTSLLVLVALVIVNAELGPGKERITTVVSKVDSNEFLSFETDATLHPIVRSTCRPNCRGQDDQEITESQAGEIADELGTELREAYDEVFSVSMEVLGNQFRLDMRYGAWLCPFVLITVELFLFILRRKIVVLTTLRTAESKETPDEQSRRQLYDQVLHQEPNGTLRLVYHLISLVALSYFAVSLAFLFPDADFSLFLLPLAVWVYYTATYGHFIAWRWRKLRTDFGHHPADASHLWGSLARLIRNRKIRLAAGNGLLFITLLMPIGCDSCGDSVTGWEMVQGEGMMPVTSAALSQGLGVPDEPSTDLAFGLGRLWAADALPFAIYFVALLLAPIAFGLQFRWSRHQKLKGLLSMCRRFYGLAFPIVLFDIAIVIPMALLFDALESGDNGWSTVVGIALVLVIIALLVAVTRYARRRPADLYLSGNRLLHLVYSVPLWVVCYTSFEAFDVLLWGLPTYVVGLYVMREGLSSPRGSP